MTGPDPKSVNPAESGSWINASHHPEGEGLPTVAAILESIARTDGGGISILIPKVGLDLKAFWRRALEAEDLRYVVDDFFVWPISNQNL